MSLAESIYKNSPIILQHLMATCAGFVNFQKRYGMIYRRELEFLRNFDTWPIDKKLEYQRSEFVKFVKFAYSKSPFYSELYKDLNISSIKELDDIKRLPIVDKEQLRKNIANIVTTPGYKAIKSNTGGTTGKSLEVYFTRSDFMKRMALLDHFKSRVGFKHLKMRRATFNGKHIVPPNQNRPIFWRYNGACKQMIYSSFHLTESNLRYYIDSLNRFQPHALDGFFSSICDVASYILRHNIKLNFKPVAIFPTSETLTLEGRLQIEQAFNCKVYDQYASSEGAPFVTECQKQILHIEHCSGLIETVPGTNEILVTSFTTHGTPLIRYKIGDAMIMSKPGQKCCCGLDSRLVKSIQGRKVEYLLKADGAKINSGNIANLFKKITNAIVRAQLLQTEVGKINILLHADKSKYKKEFDALLRDEFLHKFGSSTSINIIHVDEIPREKSGKTLFVKNSINKQ